MRRILKFLMSRSFFFGVMILLQIALFVALMVTFSRVGGVAYLLITIVVVMVMMAVLERTNTNPAYRIMWLLIVVTMPMSGALFYLLWGSHGIKPKKAEDFLRIEHRVSKIMRQDEAVTRAFCSQYPEYLPHMEYLARNAAAPLYQSTQVEYYPFGQDFFPRFLEKLKAARHYIFMEYFIVQDGEMWGRTLEILRQKAKEGVDVRVLYDGFGCLFTLPPNYAETLRAQGIQCFAVSPFRFSWHPSDYKLLNHRDHRKITVIDGEVGFTGGMNFADEYINRKKRFGVWKDTGFMLQGPAVFSLTVTFLKMWDYVAETRTQYLDYLPESAYPASEGFVQPYCDSPLDSENVAENAYFNVLRHAQHYVYLMTPYLILDNEMTTELCLSAKSGVDVRIITPGIPDKPYVYYVTQSYYPELLRAGVRIYEYTPGFVHAKMFVSDGKLAIVGSANTDYRSLYLHYENCCQFFGGQIVNRVKEDFEATMAVCHEVTAEDIRRVPLYKWLAQMFLRLFAPLM